MMHQQLDVKNSNRSLWLSGLLHYLVYAVVAVRTIAQYAMPGGTSLILVVALLALLLALNVFSSQYSQRLPGFFRVYVPVYTVLAFALGLLPPYFDMWAALYLGLCIPLVRNFSLRTAGFWLGFHALIILGVLAFTQGLTGLTAGLTVVGGGAFLVSYELLYIQAERARIHSQSLLTDLQSAHLKLQEYASQAEELMVTQERNRLARELHDSTQQAIFSITLHTQATRLLVDKDPSRVPAQLDRLQQMTSDVLAQLRSLITQLRPPQTG